VAKKSGLKKRLEEPSTARNTTQKSGTPEKDGLARKMAQYVERKEELNTMEREVEALRVCLVQEVRPHCVEVAPRTFELTHRGVRMRCIRIEPSRVPPEDFYGLVGEEGFRFLRVSSSQVKKAIASGELSITDEDLAAISVQDPNDVHERVEVKIVSASAVAELFR
jgi:hypothetical protein